MCDHNARIIIEGQEELPRLLVMFASSKPIHPPLVYPSLRLPLLTQHWMMMAHHNSTMIPRRLTQLLLNPAALVSQKTPRQSSREHFAASIPITNNCLSDRVESFVVALPCITTKPFWMFWYILVCYAIALSTNDPPDIVPTIIFPSMRPQAATHDLWFKLQCLAGGTQMAHHLFLRIWACASMCFITRRSTRQQIVFVRRSAIWKITPSSSSTTDNITLTLRLLNRWMSGSEGSIIFACSP